MTAGLSLTREQVKAITARLREGVESHTDIAADLGLSRHSVDRIARIHGMPSLRTERLPKPPPRTDVTWMEQAACAGIYGFTELHVEQQQEVCKGCPVRGQCLEFGLAGPTPTVHWEGNRGPVHGGVTPKDLRRLSKMQLERVDLAKLRAEAS